MMKDTATVFIGEDSKVEGFLVTLESKESLLGITEDQFQDILEKLVIVAAGEVAKIFNGWGKEQ